MRKEHKSLTIFMFMGILLIVIFGIGLTVSRNPGAFHSRYRVDYALESFVAFCGRNWLPAGIIGIPMFLVSLFISLWQEGRR